MRIIEIGGLVLLYGILLASCGKDKNNGGPADAGTWDADSDSASSGDRGSDTVVTADSASERDTGADTAAVTDSESETREATDTDTRTETESESQSASESATETMGLADSATREDTGTDTASGSDSLLETDEPADTMTAGDSDTALDTGPDTATVEDSASASDTGTGTGTVSDQDPDAGADGSVVEPNRCRQCIGFAGADILVVVDNSGSMIEEQTIMATQFYTLLNSLVFPTEAWEYAGASSVRVGIVSSDLGLQWGDGQTGGNTTSVKGCGNDLGEDGLFHTAMPSQIQVESQRLPCDADGLQCPTDEWTCASGRCVAPGGGTAAAVPCEALDDTLWTETSAAQVNGGLVNQAACMAQLGTQGCGIEQQLQASIRALTHEGQQGFLRDDHVLAVVIVSDEEDCSIEDSGLFATEEWKSGSTEKLNVACNYPSENGENYLFDPVHFHDRLVALKGGRDYAVLFAAIVGVPNEEDSPCQGNGDALDGCLDDPRMIYEPMEFEIDNYTFTHFKPACTRVDAAGVEVTNARPGRRYITLAQRFGCAGYVYSICNEDWSVAMQAIARTIAKCIVVVV